MKLSVHLSHQIITTTKNTNKMTITHLTLTDNSRVEVISRISKDMFKVSYGKNTKGNDVIGLVHRSMILLFA